mmetsp:Transcript_7938/g.32679  ORF Transcript_7938/g.32679 Transcript_7938/m.32679 type:complete len:205 (-) Transcript_7938:1876-2490(-)
MGRRRVVARARSRGRPRAPPLPRRQSLRRSRPVAGGGPALPPRRPRGRQRHRDVLAVPRVGHLVPRRHPPRNVGAMEERAAPRRHVRGEGDPRRHRSNDSRTRRASARRRGSQTRQRTVRGVAAGRDAGVDAGVRRVRAPVPAGDQGWRAQGRREDRGPRREQRRNGRNRRRSRRSRAVSGDADASRVVRAEARRGFRLRDVRR